MDNATLNRKLAEALGWTEILFHSDGAVDGYAPGATIHVKFSPATDRNHLVEYVLSELRKRNLARQLENVLSECNIWTDGEEWFASLDVLMAGPAVLAAAALKVLGGGE